MDVAVETEFVERKDNNVVQLKIVKNRIITELTGDYESCFEIDMSEDLDEIAFLSCD